MFLYFFPVVITRTYSFLNHCFLLIVTPEKGIQPRTCHLFTVWYDHLKLKHAQELEGLLKNQGFVLAEAYLNSHSVGGIDLLAYECILMDCSENLNSCFLTFVKSDPALLIG